MNLRQRSFWGRSFEEAATAAATGFSDASLRIQKENSSWISVSSSSASGSGSPSAKGSAKWSYKYWKKLRAWSAFTLSRWGRWLLPSSGGSIIPRLMFFKNFWHFRLLIPETSNHAVKHILAPQNSQPGPRDRILPSCKQLWIQNIRKNLLPNLHLLSCYLEGPYTESGSKKICLFLWEQSSWTRILRSTLKMKRSLSLWLMRWSFCVHSDCFAVKLGLEKNWTRHFAWQQALWGHLNSMAEIGKPKNPLWMAHPKVLKTDPRKSLKIICFPQVLWWNLPLGGVCLLGATQVGEMAEELWICKYFLLPT